MDFESEVKDESLEGLNSTVLIILLGLAALFIFPSFCFIFLTLVFPKVDQSLMEYIAYFFGYGGYIAILFFLLKKERVKKMLKGFNASNVKFALIFALILFLASIFTTSLCQFIFGNVDSNANQESLDAGMLKYPLIVSLFSVVFAPIVEELVFRFSIFRPIAKKSKVIAYIISVLTFAGIHFFSSLSVLAMNIDELGKDAAYSIFFSDLKTLPIYIVAAFVLTLSYDLNKNISTNIMIHGFYNLSQVIIMFLAMGAQETLDKLNSTLSLFNFNFIENILKIIGI